MMMKYVMNYEKKMNLLSIQRVYLVMISDIIVKFSSGSEQSDSSDDGSDMQHQT
jgi:hypothetical protein